MAELDARTQEGITEAFENTAVIIDEIYIDPVTIGADMNIYYSNDDNAAMEDKLWIPIPRHYVLRKGFHALPSPTRCKYIKLEFTNLAAAPYNPIEYPSLRPLRFRRFPTWVQNYFNDVYLQEPLENVFINPQEIVTIDPLELGFSRPDDKFDVSFENQRELTIQSHDDEIQDFINDILTGTSTTSSQAEVESRIKYRSPIMWQQNLILQLDDSRALTRKAKEANEIGSDVGWSIEAPVPTFPTTTIQSVPDLTVARREKYIPHMFFPRVARHGYQVVESERPGKIAYFVAIKSVRFFRRDYTIPHDEHYYIETFGDIAHTQVNDFTQDDWRYVVQP